MAYLGNDLQVAFPVYRNIDDISGSFNSSTTSFPLRVSGVAPVPAPLYSQQCLISVGGVVQRPDDSGSEGFRLSGGNIIFASAPTTGADFFGVILAGADYINAGGNFPSGTAAVPSITFNDDLDTGIYNSGINQVSITTGGSERLRIDSAGQIESVSLGTAAAPAFSFTTDPNTGIYSPGADQVAISTGGSGRLFVDASGNVGIADSTPQRDAGTTSLAIGDGSKSASVDLYGTVKNYAIYNGGSGQLGVFDLSASTERITLTSAGLVGVGTSSPAVPLHVSGDGNSLRLQRSTYSGTGETVSLDFRHFASNLSADYAGATITSVTTNSFTAGGGAGLFDAALTFSTLNDAVSAERMRISSSGNVGIGTTSPGQALHVIGNIQVGDSGNERGIYVGAAGFSGAFLYRPTGDVQLSPRSGYGITFAPAPGSATEWGRWDSSGRLLVGTSSARGVGDATPSTLEVEGTSYNSVSIVNNTNDIGSPALKLGKSRGTSTGSNVIVQNGDFLGSVVFAGADGSDLETVAAAISAVVDGTPGANDMPGRLVFFTTADGASSPTERMRISQNGGTLWRSDGATSTHDLGNSNTSITGEVITVSAYRNTVNDTFKFLTCVRQGFAVALEIRDDGDVYNVNGTYGSLSDAKLKENIVDANSQWDDIKQLRVRNYNFKPETNNSTHKQIGVIAQEIENVSPGLVNTVADRDAEGNDLGTVTKSVNYSVLYMKAVKALQEAMERIEVLEQRLTDAGIA